MKYQLQITKPYLWIPIKLGGEKTLVEIYAKEQKQFEFQIPIVKSSEDDINYDYYASINVEHLIGDTIDIIGDASDKFLDGIQNRETAPVNLEEERPEIHFTAQTGWINDPNGLVYHNGVYHLYFQYNPFDVEWDNMSWGHATSVDLLHWTMQDTVLWPDEHGMMFSGCGIRNEKELLGLNKEAIIYYYSAAGDSTPWSKGKEFTQGIAYSMDGGKHLIKYNKARIGTIEKENRDPKVFWHELSKAYIMVLWLKEDEFAILRSKDMEHYAITQRLRLEKAFECPDLFELEVDGKENEKHWVFWCADGYYYIGEFDGYTFHQVEERKLGYSNSLPYAAQTISGVNNRVITIPWLRTKFVNRLYTGAMGIPRELKLIDTTEGLLLQHRPCAEYECAKVLKYSVDVTRKREEENVTVYTESIYSDGHPLEIEILLTEGGTNNFKILIGSNEIQIDLDNKLIHSMEQDILIPYHFEWENLNLIIDHGIVELTAKNGIIYIVFELPIYENPDHYSIQYKQENQINKINIFGLEMRN
ncbi:glycoside hydrolase family 32 protein [Anaeromicropila herbilytica]|uniref:Glycosyl hydrolase family 32 N-terminal domain-containing protein n=1 Tax=Anaeromicropila herbilytica TaxID=2785025 RepID=A0A7R7EQ40_9FIRM|nr:glycoside hydrolase family 32 protein [Anaeromicropila herbilytica]BCN32675.1 hypothetical protein bsdtb5_39700 [Anaeromicropila herbilytica]